MYHILAVLACVFWGSTFVSTKILLTAGMSPSMIFFLRFLIAYRKRFAVVCAERQRVAYLVVASALARGVGRAVSWQQGAQFVAPLGGGPVGRGGLVVRCWRPRPRRFATSVAGL